MDETVNRIISLLKDRNIAKGKFLRDLGFNKSAIAGWERGEHASYKKKLPEIAEYFDVSIDWLTGKEQKNKPVTERDELKSEILELFNLLSLEERKELVDYARYKVDHQAEK